MLGLSISCVNATQIKIFDVGQGNCVAIKHGKKVLLVDAGSSERAFLVAYQQASQTGKVYKTKSAKMQSKEKEGDSSLDKATFEQEEAAIVSSQSPSSEESVSPSAVTVSTSKKYALDLKSSIREFIESGDIKEIVVVTTHGDKDHIGWLPQIFDETFDQMDRLKAVILSGFSRDYESLKQWLSGLGDDRILYTGTYTGQAGYPEGFSTPWSLGEKKEGAGPADSPVESGTKKRRIEAVKPLFARFYHSGIRDKTENEKRIEEVLLFDESVGVEVLSMNSGMAMDRVKSGEEPESWNLSRANMDSNANSLVLRVQNKEVKGKSILLPGDADETTWGRIAAQGPVEPVTYMLLSHHGSQEHGATSKILLEIFKPKALFVSAGQHKGYHHPALSVMDTCRQYLKDCVSETHRVDGHAITYFSPEKVNGKIVYSYRRRLTKLPIFSTITQGTMEIDLEDKNDGIKIEASRDRSRLFSYEEKEQRTLFLASRLQIFKNEQEAVDTLKKNSAGKVILFEESDTSSEAENDKTVIKISNEKIETQVAKETLEEDDLALETEDCYYVLRKKNDQLFVYNVLPYEEDQEEL